MSLEAFDAEAERLLACEQPQLKQIASKYSGKMAKVDYLDCEIVLGIFNRWYIFKAGDRSLAWTGSNWAATDNGLPKAGGQICNFDTLTEARLYVLANGLTERAA